jgi:hypothetical protein
MKVNTSSRTRDVHMDIIGTHILFLLLRRFNNAISVAKATQHRIWRDDCHATRTRKDLKGTHRGLFKYTTTQLALKHWHRRCSFRDSNWVLLDANHTRYWCSEFLLFSLLLRTRAFVLELQGLILGRKVRIFWIFLRFSSTSACLAP